MFFTFPVSSFTKSNRCDFVANNEWSPNSYDLNPLDYQAWGYSITQFVEKFPVVYLVKCFTNVYKATEDMTTSPGVIINTPCREEKGATIFFAITLPNPNRSSKFFYHHT